ncbi:hypothetical protein A0H76_2119 [Hepatospora eriocheir]|uniref:Uncharacterized protein n=1 Tax=Hepatospora eriocheir TaxID=1081669 RepID=A0A1X0QG60_9MICR|nr:hypothetical protein A0H76_2119 [Hepatospora eriocheir]
MLLFIPNPVPKPVVLLSLFHVDCVPNLLVLLSALLDELNVFNPLVLLNPPVLLNPNTPVLLNPVVLKPVLLIFIFVPNGVI